MSIKMASWTWSWGRSGTKLPGAGNGHQISAPGKYDGATGYSKTFCCWNYDLNQDGWQDLISVSFPGDPFHWFENPQNQPGHWKKHEIWHSACNETPLILDVTGDGKPEIIVGSQPTGQIGFRNPYAGKIG